MVAATDEKSQSSPSTERSTFSRRLGQFNELLRLPVVEIAIRGGSAERGYFQTFTKRHPRFKIIQNKSWGVALLPVPAMFARYLDGKERQAVRTNRNRAMKNGFVYRSFNSAEFLDEIMAIHQSAERRQDQPIGASYLNPASVAEHGIAYPLMRGVFNQSGKLRAYLSPRDCGDVVVVSRLMGHHDDLKQGVMYLLVSELVREISERTGFGATAKWMMYDTYFGAMGGLRYFKDRLGFQPYRVKWRWQQV